VTTATRTSGALDIKGMQVYDTDTNSIFFFNGTSWVNAASSAISQSSDVETLPHTQQATIANGANLIYNATIGTWESDTVEAYFDSDTWQATPWGLEFRLELSDTQFYWRNATSSLMYYFKEYRVIRIADGVLDWMHLTDNLPAGHQRYVWRDNSLNLYNSGDQEEMKVRIYGGVGYWQEYHIILSVGIGYNDNHLLIKRLR
jgi:hypothetical protein